MGQRHLLHAVIFSLNSHYLRQSWIGEFFSGSLGDYTHPMLEHREIRKQAVVLVTTDKGLCGALNANLFRLALQFDPETTLFIAAGRKSAQFIARSRRQLVAEFAYSETPRFSEAVAIGAFASTLFLKREVDAVKVIAARFVNTLTQQPMCIEFLPIGQIRALEMAWTNADFAATTRKTECLFEPGREDVLDFFLTRYPNIYMYQVLLNARASKHSAR
ncbi:MAG: FoF1 ATP synthase subunit gamma, partial [Terracidiphilus sp.]